MGTAVDRPRLGSDSLVDVAGRMRRVIESAGRYDPEQIETFHEHCFEYDLPYELW